MRIELKRCPFCGSKETGIHGIRGKKGWFVFGQCKLCGAQSKTFHNPASIAMSHPDEDHESIGLAISAWNHRWGEEDE